MDDIDDLASMPDDKILSVSKDDTDCDSYDEQRTDSVLNQLTCLLQSSAADIYLSDSTNIPTLQNVQELHVMRRYTLPHPSFQRLCTDLIQKDTQSIHSRL